MKQQDYKRITVSIIAFAMMLSCMNFGGKNVVTVKADNTGFITENINIEQYISSDKVPKPTSAEYKEYLFAGWYEDEGCKEYILDKTGLSGKKYAKFVSPEVLSVKCQNLEGTTDTTEKTSMRVVTTVDSLFYKEVGFDIQIGKATQSVQLKKVYKKIIANEDGVAFSYEPNIFSDSSKYFSTVTLTNIPNKGFSKGIYLKPYWVTPDGTKVYGVERYARVEDSWLDVLNVPIRLYSEKEVAAGCLRVSYNKDEYEYIGTDTGDIGDVFQEMYVKDNGKGMVSCVGNSDPIGNVVADGLMVSLRFKKIGSNTDSSITFGVSDEEFANYDGNSVFTNDTEKKFDVSDVIYKLFTQ